MADVTIRFKGDERDAVRAADSTRRSIGGIDDQAKRTGPNLKALGIVALGAFAAIGIAARTGFAELAEGEKVAAQTEAALKSTGGAANVTADEIGSLATTLSRLSGIDDELIQKGENLLLTFKNVRNEVGQGNRVFDRATTAALDLSVAGFGALESTSKLLGKALNDPIRGLTALNRAGVTFSEDQKKTIERLVETGQTLEAQKLILAEVESQVGGSAKAYGETLPGQLAKARVQFENLAGNLVGTLLPAFLAVAGVLNGVFGFLAEHETTTQILVGAIIALATAMGVVSVSLSVARTAVVAYTAVQWLLNAALTANPIGILVVALAALVAGIIIAWRESETFRAIVTAAFDAVRGAAEFVLEFFRTHWKTIAVLISGPFAPIVILATDAFGIRSAIVGAFNAVIAFVRNRWPEMAVLIAGPFAPLVALATDAFGVRTALVNAFRAVVSFVSNVVDQIVGFFLALPGQLASMLGPLGNQALAPMRALFARVSDAVDAIRGGISWLRDNVVRIMKAIAEAASGPLGVLAGAFSAVADAIGRALGLVEALIRAIGRIPTPKLPSFNIPGFQHGVKNFAGGLAVVGETGPELVLLPGGSDVIPTHALGAASPQGLMPGFHVTVNLLAGGYFVGGRDALADELGRLLVPRLGQVAMYGNRI